LGGTKSIASGSWSRRVRRSSFFNRSESNVSVRSAAVLTSEAGTGVIR
jgi:hypothetical protein